jgi:hypothetical protein
MLYWILQILYEYLWVTVLYVGMYWGGHIFMRDHARILKVAFNVDLRYFSYSENGSTEQHDIMHTMAAVLTAVILCVNPVVHSMIFFWFRFMDITQLNRLVIYGAYLQLARLVNIMDRPWYITRKVSTTDLFLGFQLLYTSLNFWNRSMFIPTVFYLLDEMWDLGDAAGELHRVHNALLGRDDKVSNKLLLTKGWFVAKRKTLGVLRLGTLFTFIILSILYSDLSTVSEILFYFGAAGRIAYLYTEKDPEKLH